MSHARSRLIVGVLAVIALASACTTDERPWSELTLDEQRARAEQGSPIDQFNLGDIYLDGDGVPEDAAEAVKWYRLAAEQGLARAQYNLGIIYQNGMYGVPEDAAKAVKWYRLAAEQGYAAAQYNLGVKYTNGDGVPEDAAEAVKWYRLAAAQGNARATGQPRACVYGG